MNTIVPVLTAQVGWVTLDTVGTAGALGTAFTVTVPTEELSQVVSLNLRTLKV